MVSKKINLGLIFQEIDNWQGGFNYYCSLISSLKYINNKNKKFNFIIFTSKKNYITLKKLKIKKKNIFISSLFNKISLTKFFDKLLEKIFNRNYILEKILINKKINILTHYFKKNFPINIIPWIPDLQHKYLKNFFTIKEILKRDKIINNYLLYSKDIIVSSRDTKKSLKKFYNVKNNNIHILNFVPELNFGIIQKKSDDLIKKFKISKKFIYIPNQFWIHKNHDLLIRAASILKKKNIYYQFVLSGNHKDYRNKKHFNNLKNLIKTYDVGKYFFFLGFVNRKDLINLIYHSDFMINPSSFEGWSTVVEEAKILNQRILLSDIDVHKEQKNSCCTLFSNNCEKDLAKKIIICAKKKKEKQNLKLLYKRYIINRKNFAIQYINILKKNEI